MNALAQNRIGISDNGAFSNAGEARQHVLDLGAENLETAAIDHVLAAVENTDEAGRVHGADIPRAPEAVDELARISLGPLPIARHHHGSRNPELAWRAGRHRRAYLVDHLN